MAQGIDQAHQQQHRAQDGGGLAHVEQAHVEGQQLAQPAGTHHPQHGSGADVVLPAVQRVAEQLRQHLWQRGVHHHRAVAHALCPQRGPGAGRGVLDRFSKQPAEHAGGVQRQRQRAGKRPQPGRDQQQAGPDQLGHRAQCVQQQARGGAGARSVVGVQAAGRQRQRQAAGHRQQRAQGRHRQRLPGAQRDLEQERGRGVGREKLGDEAAHAARRVER